MTVIVLRGDARRLPLPDASVDLIVCSPPYWALRDYGYPGQIGSEPTWQQWLANLIDCTREWARVLKPTGSMFVNLGDKYSTGNSGESGMAKLGERWAGGGHSDGKAKRPSAAVPGMPPKSLLLLPERYVIACADQLGLILRRDIIWAKPNGLPESVTDRCRSSHEYLFHLVRQPRYYAAVDEIREPHEHHRRDAWDRRPPAVNGIRLTGNVDARVGNNPLGKLPGSVWDIPSQPLTVPAHLGVDHFAAFPMELPRRCVLGWSPPGICTSCGEGRRPVTTTGYEPTQATNGAETWRGHAAAVRHDWPGFQGRQRSLATITGYACACTPCTDHPGTGGVGDQRKPYSDVLAEGRYPSTGVLPGGALQNRERVGPWREYHFDGWTPPPTRPAVVLDPFSGTGTTLLAASALGRIGIGVDLSADYCRLARWRVNDPGERAKAMQVPKPPPIPDGMEALF